MDAQRLLDRCKEKTGSDSKTAEKLAVPKSQISDWRNGRQPMPAYHAARLAELIGERWTDYAIGVLADQARTDREREYWRKKAIELAKTGALVLMIGAGVLTGNLNPEEAFNGLALISGNIQCAQ